jgi:transposase
VADVPPVPDEAAALRAANARLRQVEEAKDTALLTSHQGQLEVLRAQVAALAAEVTELRAQPPSQDGPAGSAPKSLRGRSGRKPGRAAGQPGVTLKLAAGPETVIVHEPGRCAGCGKDLAGASAAGMVRDAYTMRVFQLPWPEAGRSRRVTRMARAACGKPSLAATVVAFRSRRFPAASPALVAVA